MSAVRWIRVEGSWRRVPGDLAERLLGPWPDGLDAEFESNGCGPKKPILDRLVPDVWRGYPLYIACHLHDWAYHVGGGVKDRMVADWYLGRNVATVAEYYGATGVAGFLRRNALGTAYFLGVRVGGIFAWTWRRM